MVRRSAADELDDEIAFHLEMRARELAARGEGAAAAREHALRRFGDLDAVRSECLAIARRKERRMRWREQFENLTQDVRFALRWLARSPGFTAVVLLMLAIGIGANTATFTLVDALLLRTLPVPEPDRLVRVGDQSRTGGLSQGAPRTDLASYPVYADVRDGNDVLTGLYATGRAGLLDVRMDAAAPGPAGGRPSDAGGEAEHPRARLVSGEFFSVLGVRAYRGRTFTGAEDRIPGGDPVVVLSFDYWQRRFGGSAVLGRTIAVNGVPLTVIGVTPPGFAGDLVGQPQDLWIPLMMEPVIMGGRSLLQDRNASWLLLMGRLRPGRTLSQAQSELRALFARSLTEHLTPQNARYVADRLRRKPVEVASGATGFSHYRSVFSRPLLTLLAAVALLLLLVCANVANLILARGAARKGELAVRVALGAGRLRLGQQLFTESLLLGVLGGAAGLLVARWGSAVLLAAAGGERGPMPLDRGMDFRVLAFTAVVTLLATILAGSAPALRALRVAPARVLRGSGWGSTASASASRRATPARILVVTQVALSALLLVATGLLVRSTRRLESTDLGVTRSSLLIASLDARRSGLADDGRNELVRQLVERVAALPGVAGVTASENGLFSGTESTTSLQVEGFTARVDADTEVAYDDVTPGYFRVVGAHLLRGRAFDDVDTRSSTPVAIVDETMARFYFPGGDALGRHLTIDGRTIQIVGIVADVEEQGLRDAPVRRLYVPMAQLQTPPTEFSLEVRTRGDPARLAVAVRRALAAGQPGLAILDVSPLSALVRESIQQDRLVARTVATFGGLSLFLAAVGLYGVMAFAALRRRAEFGVRMALGARANDVAGMVLRESLVLTAAGLALGLPVALLGSVLLRTQLFGVHPLDAPSLGVAVAALLVAAAVAGYLPARWAARVSPTMALRAG